MPVGFRKWVVGKALKEGTKAIRSVLPGAKFKGQKTISQHKIDAAFARARQKSFEHAEEVKKIKEKNINYKKTKHFYAPKDF